MFYLLLKCNTLFLKKVKCYETVFETRLKKAKNPEGLLILLISQKVPKSQTTATAAIPPYKMPSVDELVKQLVLLCLVIQHTPSILLKGVTIDILASVHCQLLHLAQIQPTRPAFCTLCSTSVYSSPHHVFVLNSILSLISKRTNSLKKFFYVALLEKTKIALLLPPHFSLVELKMFRTGSITKTAWSLT